MTLSFMNNKGYIFIVRRLGKQSKLILSRLDSISNLKLNLRIHGLCGPDAHAGADLQVFLIFYFNPILLSAHKLPLLIYGDNTCIRTYFNSVLNFHKSLGIRTMAWRKLISNSAACASPMTICIRWRALSYAFMLLSTTWRIELHGNLVSDRSGQCVRCPCHRMTHALFLTATALVPGKRALRLRHHRLQWVDTTEKAQRSLLCGGTATRTTLLLVTCCIVVFVVFS